MDRTLELVVFELNDGVTHEDFMATVTPVSEWVSTQPGFISRELVHSPDTGKYIDIVWWRTRAEADAAAEAAIASSICAPMFGRISLESTTMLHGDLAEKLRAA